MIDWFRVITDLQKNKISIVKQSEMIGVSWKTVCNWRDGTEPKFSDGKKLIEIWQFATMKNENELPTRNI